MKAPTIVRIGSRDFTISLTEPPIDPDNRGTLGKIDYSNSGIKIDAVLDVQTKSYVLWHEIVHGIDNQYFGLRLLKSEQEAELLGEALAQVMRDLGIVFVFEDTPT